MLALTHRLNTILLTLTLLVGLAILALLATRSDAGPLDPPAPPASTGIPIDEAGSWSRNLSGVGGCNSPRFKCVLPTAAQPTGEGVLDRETGLVWQRTVSADATTWHGAIFLCTGSTAGDRLGWRLATLAELRSVANRTGDGVPSGMPVFPGGVADREYWSATTYTADTTTAYSVDFDQTTSSFIDGKDQLHGRWCVRGPSSGDY